MAKLLAKIGAGAGALPMMLDEYRRCPSTNMIRLFGADRFPASSPLLVPT
jgi:hypothetical protein